MQLFLLPLLTLRGKSSPRQEGWEGVAMWGEIGIIISRVAYGALFWGKEGALVSNARYYFFSVFSRQKPPPLSQRTLFIHGVRSPNSTSCLVVLLLWSVMNVACSKLIKINLSLYFAENYYYVDGGATAAWKIGGKERERRGWNGTPLLAHSVKINWWSEQNERDNGLGNWWGGGKLRGSGGAQSN